MQEDTNVGHYIFLKQYDKTFYLFIRINLRYIKWHTEQVNKTNQLV